MTSLDGGRELDALVAEKVMGRTLSASPDFILGKQPYVLVDTPRYSTDIAATWQVVEHFERAGHSVKVETYWRGGWYCAFDHGTEDVGQASAETVPLAICHAALAAVGSQTR